MDHHSHHQDAAEPPGHLDDAGTPTPTRHEAMTPHAEHPAGYDRHAGHSVSMFRDKFWLSLALTIPVVLPLATLRCRSTTATKSLAA
jgi:Cu2+-exporting ATPase